MEETSVIFSRMNGISLKLNQIKYGYDAEMKI